MKIVFVSNYYNHHQSAISEEFFRQTGGSIESVPQDNVIIYDDYKKLIDKSFNELKLLALMNKQDFIHQYVEVVL